MVAGADWEAPSGPGAAPSCAFCLQPVSSPDGRSCPRCRVVYHPDCWKANGSRCAVYGCEPGIVPAAPARVTPTPNFRNRAVQVPQGSGLPWGVISGCLIAVVQVLRLFSGSSTPSPLPRPTVERVRSADLRREQNQSALNLALWKQQAGDYDGAIIEYTKAIREDSTLAASFRNRGVCRLMKKKFQDALGDFTRALDLDPQDEAAWRDRGYVNGELGHPELALSDCSRALQLDPRDSQAYQYRSAARQALGDWKGAIEDCSSRIELNPNDGFVYCNRGMARVAMNDPAGALQDFTHAIRLEPLNPAGYEHRAHLEYDQRLWSQALIDYRRMIELKYANSDDAQFRIWLIRSRNGEREAADRELREAFRIRFNLEPKVWEVQIASYLTGALLEEDLLKAARDSAPSLQSARFCGASFYIGSRHLIENDRDGAAVHLQRGIDTGEKKYREFASAAAELESLKKR